MLRVSLRAILQARPGVRQAFVTGRSPHGVHANASPTAGLPGQCALSEGCGRGCSSQAGASAGSSSPPEVGSSGAEQLQPPTSSLKVTKTGTYDLDYDNDRGMIPVEGSNTHLYDARGLVEKWLGHPTFWGMISEDAIAKTEASRDGPFGEGPILRWQTRVVLGPGGDGFHPANRKVSVAVYVKELGISRRAKARLLALVGKRYNPGKDELTITSERYEEREENRKDVLKTLIALIHEAKAA